MSLLEEVFKGPFSSGWCEIPHMYATASHHSHLWYKEVTDRYGPIARVGPNDLITSSPELLVHMSAPGRDHIFSVVDEEKHTKRRQQMAAGYSGKENTDLEPTIDKYVTEFVDLIRQKYISTTTVSKSMDLARKSQFLVMDVISEIGFGRAFGNLASDTDVDAYLASTEEILRTMSVVCASDILRRIIQWPPLARLLGPNEASKSGVGKVMGTARKLIDDRLKMETDSKTDMLVAFMRHGLNREDLFTEAWVQIIAGSETTASAIRGTMLYLITNARVYRKLQREIDDTLAAGLAPEVVPDTITRDLVYLQAKVPKGGDTVFVEGKSVFLPGGTNVGYSVNGLHHRKDILGEDAELFRPERWIGGGDVDWITEMKRTTELIFGYGKYQCLGKNIAWMEYSKAVFELLRNFDFAVADPLDCFHEKNCVGTFVCEGLWVLVTDRTDKY
ncbi:cytochrome P450 [Bimuria novae-zelandiae CBS 107.79]|uniref:Cytochrome P450 n=1 Tax=Bimuria novae-zelandiae CBS 107.79 TaxID=1447943 RepID=A0A6A5VL49_9PLEO|nr:cytochrome P450 [Bimuria novae-zelandiae CBS 107.79]